MVAFSQLAVFATLAFEAHASLFRKHIKVKFTAYDGLTCTPGYKQRKIVTLRDSHKAKSFDCCSFDPFSSYMIGIDGSKHTSKNLPDHNCKVHIFQDSHCKDHATSTKSIDVREAARQCNKVTFPGIQQQGFRGVGRSAKLVCEKKPHNVTKPAVAIPAVLLPSPSCVSLCPVKPSSVKPSPTGPVTSTSTATVIAPPKSTMKTETVKAFPVSSTGRKATVVTTTTILAPPTATVQGTTTVWVAPTSSTKSKKIVVNTYVVTRTESDSGVTASARASARVSARPLMARLADAIHDLVAKPTSASSVECFASMDGHWVASTCAPPAATST